jgi:[protein-PII] uridylyltransferase
MNKMLENISFSISFIQKKDDYLLSINFSKNQLGIIYKITAILFAYGWDIIEANFETDSDGKVQDKFLVRSFRGEIMDEDFLEKIKKDIHDLFYTELMVIDYLERFPNLTLTKPTTIPPIIYIFNPPGIDSTVLDIRTLDRPGLLFEISQLLYLLDIDILSVTASTEDSMVRDSFLLRKDSSDKLDERTMAKLKSGLEKIL